MRATKQSPPRDGGGKRVGSGQRGALGQIFSSRHGTKSLLTTFLVPPGPGPVCEALRVHNVYIGIPQYLGLTLHLHSCLLHPRSQAWVYASESPSLPLAEPECAVCRAEGSQEIGDRHLLPLIPCCRQRLGDSGAEGRCGLLSLVHEAP